MTNAYLVNGATETALNVVNEAGISYLELGALPNSGSQSTIRFEGPFTTCAAQTVKVAVGYDCVASPSSYAGRPFYEEKEYTLQPLGAAIQLDILSEPSTTVDTCTDYNVVLEARNAGEGNLGSPLIEFDIPGDVTSLSVVGLDVEYPRGSGNIESLTPTINGNTVGIDLSLHSGIATARGLPGSSLSSVIDEQIAIVTLTMNPQCNYRSNTGTTYIITGNDPCGVPATGSGSRLASNPVVITGAEPPYSTNSVAISSPNFEGCEQQNVSVETYIVDGTTGPDDFTRIILPEGLAYVSGSFSSTGSVNATFIASNTVGGREQIEIGLPAGAITTDLIGYNFDVESTPTICAGDYEIELSTYVTTTGLSCGGVSCGTTEIVTGEASTSIMVSKAALTATSYAATAQYVQNGPDNAYYFDLEVANTGNEDLAPGTTYEVFCLDGSGNKAGAALYSGILAQGIPVGGSLQESFNFTTTVFCGPNSDMLVEFAPGSSNCFCEDLDLHISSSQLPSLGDVRFVDDSITVNEADGTVTLEVVYNGSYGSPFTVDFASQDDSATAGQDYTATTGTLISTGPMVRF